VQVKERIKEVASNVRKKSGGKGKKKWIRIAIIVLIVAAILFGVLRCALPKDEKTSSAVIMANAVTRGDVVNYLTGSGMIEAMDSYDIVAKVQGDILSSPFEEGQIVNKDDVLYVFDSEDAQQSLRSQQNSYDSQNRCFCLYRREDHRSEKNLRSERACADR
jgi:HlyD family secretion protein